MKTIVRTLVVISLLVIALPLSLANAQDGGETYTTTPVISAVYYIPATAGTFEEVDDVYLLTLEGVELGIDWIMTSPMLSIRTFNNDNLTAQWAANDELAANAVLQVDDLNVMLTLSSPTYDVDTGVQTYVAVVGDIVAPADVKEPELPMAFEAVNLSIEWTNAFQEGLLIGIDEMYEGVRATPAECAHARNEYRQYQDHWLPPRIAAHDALIWPCLGGDGAACQLMSQISMEMAFKSMEMAPVLAMINTECTNPARGNRR